MTLRRPLTVLSIFAFITSPASSLSILNAPPSTFGASLAQQKQHNAGAKYNGKNRVRAWRYKCDVCACGFDKLKSYRDHLEGKRHKSTIAEAETVWEDYSTRSWPVFYDPSVAREDVTRSWSLDRFADGLPARSRSSAGTLLGDEGGGQIDPGLMVRDLPPSKRAALWRYLRDVGAPGLVAMVSSLPPRHARVKELLESAEAFRHVRKLAKKQRRGGRDGITDVYDVGCGHGLVGMLCAAAWPDVRVHALDVEPRDSFDAQRDGFASGGTLLDNLMFVKGDLSDLEALLLSPDWNKGAPGGDGRRNGLLLCVHGCKSLTPDAIGLARRNGWAWLALPCCLTQSSKEDVLGGASLRLPDDTRFALLCGALAERYGAESVASIDPRITARGIVLSSSSVDDVGNNLGR